MNWTMKEKEKSDRVTRTQKKKGINKIHKPSQVRVVNFVKRVSIWYA